ncbi:unnamed protein product [marine sediment metagenome]|uniref:Uncharacterized protein n=1 Tax=marine sediment metagenome TaxID=412755 RepID=X0U426_9ZZZZ
MLWRKDNEIPEPEITLWLERNGIPKQRYHNLSNNEKVVLGNLLKIPTRPTSPQQRKDLYTRLCLPDLGGRESIDPTDFVPDDKIEEFFTPIAPSETLSEREKY